MATYNELLKEFNLLPGWKKGAFLAAHPKFAAKLTGETSTSTGGTGGSYTPGYGALTPTPTPGPDEEAVEDEERPPKPPAVPGFTWTWDEDSGDWEAVKDDDTDPVAQEDVRAELKSILEMFGQATEGNLALIEQAVREEWSPTKFLQELRQSSDYLANPLFAANVQRAKDGKGFMPEGTLISYATEAKRLAKQYGYMEPSDTLIAQGFGGGMALTEYQSRLGVQQRVDQFGPNVATLFKQLNGRDPSAQELFDIFNPEVDTEEFERRGREAEMRGRPFSLGLGQRSEAEYRQLEALGVNPDEAFSRYQSVASNAGRFARFQSIEDLLAKGLPDNFGLDLSTQENSLLLKAFLTPGTVEGTEAFAKLQNVMVKEAARWKRGGVTATQGQLTSLLSGAEKQNYQ